MLKDNLGGEAFTNGLFFYGLNFQVTGFKTKGQLHFTNKKQQKLRKRFINIPVISGIAIAWPLSFLYYYFINNPTFLLSEFEISLRMILILSFLVGYFYVFNRSAREYHGAEHMVANTFFDDKDVADISALKDYSTQSKHCGSTFMILFTIVSFLISLIIWLLPDSNLTVVIAAIIIPGITYEIHSADESLKFIKPIIKIALFIQDKLLVSPPTEDKLELASQTLVRLIKLEEDYLAGTKQN